MFEKQPAGRVPLDQRRVKRELFFWTAHQWIKLAVEASLAIYLVISLVTGHDPLLRWLPFLK